MNSMLKNTQFASTASFIRKKDIVTLLSKSSYTALTFILLLLLCNFPQLLCELIDDLLLFQLLAGQNSVEIRLENQKKYHFNKFTSQFLVTTENLYQSTNVFQRKFWRRRSACSHGSYSCWVDFLFIFFIFLLCSISDFSPFIKPSNKTTKIKCNYVGSTVISNNSKYRSLI